jgi:hypothetical protein
MIIWTLHTFWWRKRFIQHGRDVILRGQEHDKFITFCMNISILSHKWTRMSKLNGGLLLKLLPFKYSRRPCCWCPAWQQLRCWQPNTAKSVGGGADMDVVSTQHSFLKNRDNWMDIVLVHQWMVDHPLSVHFGWSSDAWRVCAWQLLSLAKDRDGMLVAILKVWHGQKGHEKEVCWLDGIHEESSQQCPPSISVWWALLWPL